MRSLIRTFARLSGNRSGATAIEYALVAGFIALGIIVAVSEIGTKANDSFVAANDGFN